jgi:hypothetical protein
VSGTVIAGVHRRPVRLWASPNILCRRRRSRAHFDFVPGQQQYPSAELDPGPPSTVPGRARALLTHCRALSAARAEYSSAAARLHRCPAALHTARPAEDVRASDKNRLGIGAGELVPCLSSPVILLDSFRDTTICAMVEYPTVGDTA